MSLEYLREYRTYFHIGKHYGLGESTAYKTIQWVEDILIKSRVLSLPGRKALLESQMNYEVVLVDATQTPIERPTLKTQLVIDKASQKVICTSLSTENGMIFICLSNPVFGSKQALSC